MRNYRIIHTNICLLQTSACSKYLNKLAERKAKN